MLLLRIAEGGVLVTWQWLSARTGTLPLVLAGPILRRVEPGMVCVWVATRQAQNIALTVQASGQAASMLAATNVTSALPNGEPTVQLGDNLFVALLIAKPPAGAPLKPGVLYFYELTFTPQGGGTSITFASAMSAPGTTTPDLSSIVYANSSSDVQFPSFSLPPQTLSQVQLAHASCRKAGGQGMDALPLLDKVIADARSASATDDGQFALNRPHQLFLTGDQIYADDVTDSYLGMCIDAAGWLMGTRQEPARGCSASSVRRTATETTRSLTRHMAGRPWTTGHWAAAPHGIRRNGRGWEYAASLFSPRA